MEALNVFDALGMYNSTTIAVQRTSTIPLQEKTYTNNHQFLGPISTQFWGLWPSWGHLGISKAQAYIPSLIFYRFCVPMVRQWRPPWAPKKSHWVPPSGHGSLQRCVFEVSFAGPTFSPNMLPENYPKSDVFWISQRG